MFDGLKDKFVNLIMSREFVMILLLFLCGGTLIYRVFDLQIVNGEQYLENFRMTIQKERSIPATRGNIYDRNGKLLAYNKLAYSVTIEDVFESTGKKKNKELNETIYKTIQLIEESGDQAVSDFSIVLDQNGNYKYNVSDTALLRFIADVYGEAYIDKLTVREKTSTADTIIEYLCSQKKFGIGTYKLLDDGSLDFTPMEGYSKADILKIITVRYDMAANGYQKYIATTIATDINEKTVAVVSENASNLKGVEIAEDTIRKYNDSVFFSQIIGYTGKISPEKLEAYKQKDSTYAANDQVGLAGIEAAMEDELRGTKGSETLVVDNTGKEIQSLRYIESVAGNDVYLTLDHDTQIAAYNILEQKIAGIVLSKIQNTKDYIPTANSGSSDIKIPIYDVYNAMIENNIIDITHFDESDAEATEKNVYEAFQSRKANVLNSIREEMKVNKTAYKLLPTEFQAYDLFILSLLENQGVYLSDSVDLKDEVYLQWKNEESISLTEYLKHCIAKDWIDVTKLELDIKYADSDEIFDKIVEYVVAELGNNTEFDKKVYKYMIKSDLVTGRQICEILCEQNILHVTDDVESKLRNGQLSAYQFMIDRIRNLEITPAMLALEPCTGSMVVTSVENGDVIACVSYPSYDNNRMANSTDAKYFASLMSDGSRPMYNYATQERTAPGSTFKMVSSTAGLMEGVIGTNDHIVCTGVFDKITPPPTCWIYPNGTHGALNVTGAIRNSCNNFFYEVGYRLGTESTGIYNSDYGIERLAQYADLYGLSETSGVEIEESSPQVSTKDAVRSAIGQGTHNYTTVGLARYVTTVASKGVCYNLTMVDKVTDHSGNLLYDNQAEIRNQIVMPSNYWNAIHEGMRQVVEAKTYFDNMRVLVAGKTGTAQQSKSHPNHSLFVSFAPYSDPEIACAVRIANGYSSDYAAQAAKDFYAYYYKMDDEENILTGQATTSATAVSNGD
ncbi:MAG: penicillin-binding protein [Lachnospiraceae bacterium]|nr:penicillin-binding protein [Lachnospiraceae bacterium]